MFNNKFNSTKKDPLVEAVQTAMQDGEIRRQAVAQVNEAFGVYNRNAVVREQLAAYDAAIEEAYKCMKEGEKWEGSKEDKDEDKKLAKKHGMTMKQWEKSDADKKHDAKEKMEEAKKLADKDYDKDGKVESPKDEVWGSRFRAAKMAGKMEEEHIDEISVGKSYSYSAGKVEKARKGLLPGDLNPSSKLDLKNMRNAAARTEKDYYKKRGFKRVDEEQIDEISKRTLGSYVGKSANANYGKEKLEREKGVKLAMKKISGKGVKVKATNEETDYSAPDRAAVTRDNKPSTPAQTNAATSGPSAADKAALASKISTMKEAASHGARELTLHAANDSQLHRSSHQPIVKNLQRKHDKGSYDHEKATKLWKYHADRAAKSYEKQHGGKFSVADRKAAAAHFADSARDEHGFGSVKEAAYSSKAARAGKDIGKPGKEFSKIAKSAAARYGSEERGKKVAGAILSKIRAKHMKEDINE